MLPNVNNTIKIGSNQYFFLTFSEKIANFMKKRNVSLIAVGLFVGAAIGGVIGNLLGWILPSGVVKDFFLTYAG